MSNKTYFLVLKRNLSSCMAEISPATLWTVYLQPLRLEPMHKLDRAHGILFWKSLFIEPLAALIQQKNEIKEIVTYLPQNLPLCRWAITASNELSTNPNPSSAIIYGGIRYLGGNISSKHLELFNLNFYQLFKTTEGDLWSMGESTNILYGYNSNS